MSPVAAYDKVWGEMGAGEGLLCFQAELRKHARAWICPVESTSLQPGKGPPCKTEMTSE
jgi:hypothetical protein